MIQGPVRGSLMDVDSVIEIASECFPHDRDNGGILSRWKHALYQTNNRFIMKDGSKVVSHVGYVDQKVLVEGDEVKVAGITFVSTLPEYRRRGFMTALLKRCIEAMTEEGYAFSDLNGNRQRYGHFGWENGGREWVFYVTKRSLDYIDTPDGYQVFPYQGSAKETDAIIAIHDQEPLGMKRNRELYEMLLNRAGKKVWLASNDGSLVSYLISEDGEKSRRVVEFGGDKDGIHAILRHFVDNMQVEFMDILSPWIHPINQKLFSISSGWNLRCLRMLKILSLELTLRGFASQLGRRYSELGFQNRQFASIGIEGTKQVVEMEFSPHNVSINKAFPSNETLILTEREMVRFIFGPSTPEVITKLPAGSGFLRGIFPVNFYLWSNETV